MTEDQFSEICARISEGEPLLQICRDPGMPSKSVVYRYLEANPEAEGRFARARRDGFDAIAEGILDIADDSRNDYVKKLSKDGDTYEVFDSEHVQRSKLRIEARLKLLAKWDPKRYGEKLAIGGDQSMDPIKTESIVLQFVKPDNG